MLLASGGFNYSTSCWWELARATGRSDNLVPIQSRRFGICREQACANGRIGIWIFFFVTLLMACGVDMERNWYIKFLGDFTSFAGGGNLALG